MLKTLLKTETWKNTHTGRSPWFYVSIKRIFFMVGIALLPVVIGIIAYLGWFIHYLIVGDTPNFFPLDDSQAQYRITKKCPANQGIVNQNTSGYAYCLEYRGDHVWQKNEQNNADFFSITIGKSNIDLEPFLDREVTNLQGRFTGSDRQCIQDKCIEIGGPYAVVDLSKLELTN